MSDKNKGSAPRRAKRSAAPRRSETDDLRRTISEWVPTGIQGGALFQELHSIRAPEPAFSGAFVQPELSAAVVESLSGQSAWNQVVAATALGGGVVLDAARPRVGVKVPVVLANVGQQFSVVAESLSQLAASVADALAPAGLIVAEAQKLAEVWRPYIAEAAASVERLAEHQREMDERTDEFVRRHGWPVPTSLSSRGYHQIMSMLGHPKREVTAFMVRSFRPGTRAFAAAREVIDESPYFESRRPLLRQVWAAQRRREWYLVINGLLPLVEGVLVDALFPPKATRPHQGWTPGIQLRTKVDVPFGDAPVRAVGTLLISGGAGLAMYGDYDPPPGVEPRVLNRHAILHGGARRYGTEQNAVRLFLVLVLMAECFELFEISREVSRHEKAVGPSTSADGAEPREP